MSQFKIEDYTPAPSANEYDEAVAALIEAGEGKSIVIPDVKPEDVAKVKRRFSEAANRADKSPRLRETIPAADGRTVGLRFTIGSRITQNREPKTDDAPAAEDSTVTDAPADEATETADDAPKGRGRK